MVSPSVKSREFPAKHERLATAEDLLLLGCDRPNAPLTALNLFAHPSIIPNPGLPQPTVPGPRVVRRRDVDDTQIQALSGQPGRVLHDLP